VEKFEVGYDQQLYTNEVKRETLLETSAEPTMANLGMMKLQINACLQGCERLWEDQDVTG